MTTTAEERRITRELGQARRRHDQKMVEQRFMVKLAALGLGLVVLAVALAAAGPWT